MLLLLDIRWPKRTSQSLQTITTATRPSRYPAPSVLPTLTASTAVAGGRSTHRRMCSHRQETFSTERLMEAATRFLLPFLVHATNKTCRQTHWHSSWTASITLSYHREILYYGKVYPDCLGNIYPIPCYGKSPLILAVSAPSGTSRSNSSWWTDLSKNLEIPFQESLSLPKAFTFLTDLALCLMLKVSYWIDFFLFLQFAALQAVIEIICNTELDVSHISGTQDLRLTDR